MGVPLDHVRVVHGDTRVTPFSLVGTGGSRSATWASGAALTATRRLKEKVLALGERDAGDPSGRPRDRRRADRPEGCPRPRACRSPASPTQAATAPSSLPPGIDHNLEAVEVFTGEGITGSGWAGGTHCCTVEVDIETGEVTILRYVVVEDCGRIINPAIVDGQVRGGVAQGIGCVLYEHAAYDDEANFLAGTFMDYLVPTAVEIPTIEIEHVESGSDGDVGFRGVGEGGAIVAPATLTNAIEDALAPFGAAVREQHLPPAKILELAGVVRSGQE